MTTRTAANTGEINAALAASVPGDIVELTSTSYGGATLAGYSFASPGVTIQPANGVDAEFSSFDLDNCDWIIVDGIRSVASSLYAFGNSGSPLSVSNGSTNCTLRNCFVSGVQANEYVGGRGISIDPDTANTLIEECFVERHRIGVFISGTDDVTVQRCFLDNLGEDSIKFGGANQTITDNWLASLQFPATDPPTPNQSFHSDGMQAFGQDITNLVMTGNILIKARGASQGVQFGGLNINGALIAQNIFSNELNNGILFKVSGADPVTTQGDVIVRNNGVYWQPGMSVSGGPKQAAFMSISGATVNEYNVRIQNTGSLRVNAPFDVRLQNNDPGGTLYVAGQYQNMLRPYGDPFIPADFTPIAGSYVDPVNPLGGTVYGPHDTIARWQAGTWGYQGTVPTPPPPIASPGRRLKTVVAGGTPIMAGPKRIVG